MNSVANKIQLFCVPFYIQILSDKYFCTINLSVCIIFIYDICTILYNYKAETIWSITERCDVEEED